MKKRRVQVQDALLYLLRILNWKDEKSLEKQACIIRKSLFLPVIGVQHLLLIMLTHHILSKVMLLLLDSELLTLLLPLLAWWCNHARARIPKINHSTRASCDSSSNCKMR